jgi:hypothetical protein
MNLSGNAAIVCLTRGYSDARSYSRLIVRNQQIYREIKAKRVAEGIPELPLVIFHEGNIDEAAQAHILRNERNARVMFVDAATTFAPSQARGGAIGYEMMCRFYAYWIWEYCQNLEFIIRIDEDIYLRRFPYRITALPHPLVALKAVGIPESHGPTNATLPGVLESLTGVSRHVFYRDNFPYTNVWISQVGFWRSEQVASALRPVSLSEEQITNRWGDLPIVGSLLNIYAPTRVGTIPDLDYFHLSHDALRVQSGLSSRH